MIDSTGYMGTLLSAAMMVVFAGSALLIFVYLWRKNKLDMDEEAKYYVFKDKNGEQNER